MSRLADTIKLPGEIVRLPSCGLCYPDGVLDENVVNGDVMVYPMTAFDEVCMRNISQIINGQSITEVFTRCIPQILKPEELYSKDVDMLLIYLRKVTYGNSLTISHKHTCKNAKTHKYDIPITHFIKHAKFIDPTLVNSVYTITLPNDSIVCIHPIKFQDAINIMRDSQDYENKPLSELQQIIAEATANIVQSVDGVDDNSEIVEWAKKLPATWAKMISDAVQLGDDWGPATTADIECEDCKEMFTVNIPINPLTFFLD
jgi:hypothetical protein